MNTIRAECELPCLQRTGYFGSYNVAFDPYLRRISGADAAVEKCGPWCEYWTSARGQLFKRDQGKVKDMASMQALMRKCE